MNALVTDLRKVIAQHVEQADSDQVMQQILIDMKAPGCQWLFLTEAA